MRNMLDNSVVREEIIKVIEAAGFKEDIFIIGNGAHRTDKTIHFRQEWSKFCRKEPRKEYSIQFCNGRYVAIWEIGKRIDLHASIDMRFGTTKWSEIDGLQIKEIPIQSHKDCTEAAIMPIECLEVYLQFKRRDTEHESLYLNRVEGNRVEIFSSRYERDETLRKQAIEIHGTRCQVCGLSFSARYGKIGEGFIEVHHIRPISEGARNTDPRIDMVCLCSNCHSMIHRKKDKVLTVDELKAMLNP